MNVGERRGICPPPLDDLHGEDHKPAPRAGAAPSATPHPNSTGSRGAPSGQLGRGSKGALNSSTSSSAAPHSSLVSPLQPLRNQAAATEADLRALALENAALRRALRGLEKESDAQTQVSLEYTSEHEAALSGMAGLEELQGAQRKVTSAVDEALAKLHEYEFQITVIEQEISETMDAVQTSRVVRNTKQALLFQSVERREGLRGKIDKLKSNRERTLAVKQREQAEAAEIKQLLPDLKLALEARRQELRELDSGVTEAQSASKQLQDELDALQDQAAKQRLYIEAVGSTAELQDQELAALRLEMESGIPADPAARKAMQQMMKRHIESLSSIQSLAETTVVSTHDKSNASPRHKFLGGGDSSLSHPFTERHNRVVDETSSALDQTPLHQQHRHGGLVNGASAGSNVEAVHESPWFSDVEVSPPSGNPAARSVAAAAAAAARTRFEPVEEGDSYSNASPQPTRGTAVPAANDDDTDSTSPLQQLAALLAQSSPTLRYPSSALRSGDGDGAAAVVSGPQSQPEQRQLQQDHLFLRSRCAPPAASPGTFGENVDGKPQNSGHGPHVPKDTVTARLEFDSPPPSVGTSLAAAADDDTSLTE